ncbi:MAG: O-antigen ligase family protein [Actinomycetia bacterium]|nr:O-antigen ligase family protein [Actinomycetes bacterium]
MRVVEHPGLLETSIVFVVLFMAQFGTPVNWTTPFVQLGQNQRGNPLLVYGSLALVGALLPTLVGRGDAVVLALHRSPALWMLIGMISLSFVWSEQPTTSVVKIVSFVVLCLFALILAVRFDVRDLLAVLAAVLAVGTVMNLVWVMGLPSWGQSSVGWTGIAVGKNDLGNDASISMLVFIVASREFLRWRFLFYSLSAIALALLLGSQSKTSLAAGMLTFCCFIVFRVFRARRTLFGAVVVAVIVSSVLAVLFATANLFLLTTYLDKDITLSGRTELWAWILDDIANRPVLGYGFGGYWNGYFSPSHDVIVVNSWGINHAHNAFFEIALSVGLVGLGFFTVVLVRSFGRAIRHVPRNPTPAGLFPLVYLTFALMVSITESGVFNNRSGWIVFMYLALVLRPSGEATRRPGGAEWLDLRPSLGLESVDS